MNNKGLIWYQGCAVMAGAFTLFAFASHSMHDANSFSSFRQRKAIKYCAQSGETDCATKVANMSSEDILAAIKDTQENQK